MPAASGPGLWRRLGLGCLAAALLLAPACTTHLAVTQSPLPTVAPRIYPAVVSVGDTIELGFYRTNALETSPYRVMVADELRVDVTDYLELSREGLRVLPDGRIALPVIGRLSAAGRTLDALADEIASAYQQRKFKVPSVAVSVQQADRRLEQFLETMNRAAVSGRLQKRVYDESPLELPFVGTIPVLGRLLFDVRRDIKAAYAGIFGDRLEVTADLTARADQYVYVLGEVHQPGRLPLTGPLHPVQAVASAGGVRETADYRQVLMVRYLPDGTSQRWVLDLEQAVSDAPPATVQIAMQPNDVILVMKTGISRANQFVDQYIRKLLPIDVGIFLPVGN